MIFFFTLILTIHQAFAEGVVVPPVHAPTIYIEKTPPAPFKKAKPKGPILLDARPSFDFALGHMPGAISIRWQDYSQTQDPHQGALDPDLDLLSRKLRYLGINPDREVVVLGLGAQGHGEEGRIAWMLNYLGIKKVRIQNVRNIPGRKAVDDDPRNKSVAPWNPKPNPFLRIKKSEVEKIVNDKPTDKIIIDVRESTGADKGIGHALHIPWTVFINSEGEPAKIDKIKEILMEHKINPDSSLIFYSENGLSSGYVTFALTQAGLHAQNYDGGFEEWSGESK